MSGKSCFFTGHRDVPETVYPALYQAVQKLTEERGVTDFLVGHYGYFDRMAVRAVLAVKRQMPEICFTILLPYHPSEQPAYLPNGADGTFYPPGMEFVPKRFAIVRANRYAVDHVDYLIAYVRHPASNARQLLEYAKRREKKGLMRVVEL